MTGYTRRVNLNTKSRMFIQTKEPRSTVPSLSDALPLRWQASVRDFPATAIRRLTHEFGGTQYYDR